MPAQRRERPLGARRFERRAERADRSHQVDRLFRRRDGRCRPVVSGAHADVDCRWLLEGEPELEQISRDIDWALDLDVRLDLRAQLQNVRSGTKRFAVEMFDLAHHPAVVVADEQAHHTRQDEFVSHQTDPALDRKVKLVGRDGRR